MIDIFIIFLLLALSILIISIGTTLERHYSRIMGEIQILTRGKTKVDDKDSKYVCEMFFGDGKVLRINKEGEEVK